jgi:hypothetical protein
MPEREYIFERVIADLCHARSTGKGVVNCRVSSETDDEYRYEHAVFEMRPVDALKFAQRIIGAAVTEIQRTTQ